MAKIKEPERLVKVNETIRMYGGMYANWKSAGCKGRLPPELIDKMCQVSEEITDFLAYYVKEASL